MKRCIDTTLPDVLKLLNNNFFDIIICDLF